MRGSSKRSARKTLQGCGNSSWASLCWYRRELHGSSNRQLELQPTLQIFCDYFNRERLPHIRSNEALPSVVDEISTGRTIEASQFWKNKNNVMQAPPLFLLLITASPPLLIDIDVFWSSFPRRRLLFRVGGPFDVANKDIGHCCRYRIMTTASAAGEIAIQTEMVPPLPPG